MRRFLPKSRSDKDENSNKALAVRLAEMCWGMGLDDIDEDLLWQYVAVMEDGSSFPKPIFDVLDQKSEFDPVMIVGYSWKATIPERFYNPERMKKAAWGFGLRSEGIRPKGPDLYVRSLSDFTVELSQQLAREAFYRWIDEITACLRPDKLNWEPPTDKDVTVTLKIKSISLTDKLSQFS